MAHHRQTFDTLPLFCVQLTEAVQDPEGMQLSALDSRPGHYLPHRSLHPFPLVAHLLASPSFRGVVVSEQLILALSVYLEATCQLGASAVPGAVEFRVRSAAGVGPIGV